MGFNELEFRLGEVQGAIESRVREHNISMTEWNSRSERVERILGALLQERDSILARLGLLTNQRKDDRIAEIGDDHATNIRTIR